jgi:glutamate-1-semialdehyde aminotransferase
VILEPFRSEWPPEGYLAAIRRMTAEYGAVLIFDEVSTGLRFSPGGVQPVVGVTPDMAVFAKSISNGYPMGVVAGRRDVMEPCGRMFVSSTYWSDTIGLCATLATIREIRRRGVPAYLEKLGSRLQFDLNRVARETGAPVRCEGICVHPKLVFDAGRPGEGRQSAAGGAPDLERRLATLYIQEMAKRGCHGYSSFYLNAAQGDAEVEQTVNAARETFALIADGLESGRIDELLECGVLEDVFRRLVR